MKIVLDTNAVLYLLSGRLAQALPSAEYFVSTITELELLSYPVLKPEEESEIHDFLNDVTVVDLNRDIKAAAIALRRQHRLKLPDALIVATAQQLEAELLTNDTKILGLPNLSARSLPLKPE